MDILSGQECRTAVFPPPRIVVSSGYRDARDRFQRSEAPERHFHAGERRCRRRKTGRTEVRVAGIDPAGFSNLHFPHRMEVIIH